MRREEVWLSAHGELFIVTWYPDDRFNSEANAVVLKTLNVCGAECLGDL